MAKQRKIHYIHFDTIDSTNTWCKQSLSTLDLDAVTCITAQEQTAGRGRFLKSWLSPKGENIYASLVFTLPVGSSIAPHISQLLSLSCCTVLRGRGFDPQIKWPNDILLAHKKVAGILTEALIYKERMAVIAGIGLNVNMAPELLESIDQPATSLAQLSGQTWALEQILGELIEQFLSDLDLLEQKGFAFFHASYEKQLAFKGEPIQCTQGSDQISGICHSISKEGRLNLLLPSGEMKQLTAGEVKGLRLNQGRL
jgi:BirA family transcriptional regulator, biotin operon repressor / biotin---[acetyl-CoA-carboxylase] ligase